MADNAEYSLTTQILMDFDNAIQESQAFEENIDAASTSIKNLSEAVRNANLNISGVINRELKKIDSKTLAPETIKIGEKLKQKIEDAIGYTLLNKNLIISGNFTDISVKLTQAQQKKLVDGVREGLLQNLKFDDFVLPKIRISKGQRTVIQEKFEEFINTSITKNLRFDLDSFKEEGTKPKLDLRITGDHMAKLVSNVEGKLNEALSSIVKVEFPEMTPIKVDSKKLVALLDNIKSKIGNLDSFITGDDSLIAAIPNFDKGMVGFRQNLRTIAQEIMKISGDIDKLQIGSSANEVKMVAGSIEDLKASVLSKIYKFITEAEMAITTIPEGTLNVAQYKQSISSIATFVDSYILGMLDKATKAVIDPMKSAMLQKQEVISAQLSTEAALKKAMEDVQISVGEPVKLDLEWLVELAKDSVINAVRESVDRFVGALRVTAAEEAAATAVAAPKKRGRPKKNTATKSAESVSNTADSLFMEDLGLTNAELKSAVINPVKEGFISMLSKAGVQVKTNLETLSGEQLTEGINVKNAIGGIDNALNKYLTGYIEKVSASMFAANADGGYQVRYKDLHPAVRKALAREANMTVNEFNKATPVLSGDSGDSALMDNLMKKNLQAIMEKFHEKMNVNTVAAIKEYHEAIGQVNIPPNIEAVHELTRQMTKLQEEIVKKIRQILNEQFQFMTDEIKNMALLPVSIGYTPSKTAQTKATSAIAGATKSVSSKKDVPIGAIVSGVPSAMVTSTGRNPGGDTRTFQGAVVNTMRYMVANQLMTAPMFMFQDAWQSAKSFDYDLEKARQNFIAKDNMQEAATRRVQLRNEQQSSLGEYGISDAEYANNRSAYIEEERARLQNMSRNGAIRPLQDIGIAYALPQEDVGKAWQIASRRLDDPYEAMALTRSASKIYATERDEISAEDAAKGLEAIASQWGFNGYQLDKVSNMVIKTSMLSQATSKDILDAMGKSGGIWRTVLPQQQGEQYDKWQERAFATGAAMQSLFVQATAASGKEAGTFWKSILMSPYQTEVANLLTQYSETPGYERLNPFVETKLGNGRSETRAKSGYENFLDVIDVATEMRGRGQEKEAMDLLTKVFKKFQIGGAMNIAALLEDMDKLQDEKKKTGVSSTDTLIQKIQETAEAEVNAMIGSLANTWQGRTQRVSTMWESTAFSVVESFKPQASDVMDTLIGIMRGIRDNAGSFASALQLTANVLLAFVAKTYGVKAWNGVKGAVMTEEFASQVTPLVRRQRDLANRRAAIVEQAPGVQSDLASAILAKDALEREQGNRRADLDTMQHKIAAEKEELEKIMLDPYGSLQEYADKRDRVLALEKDHRKLSEDISSADIAIAGATKNVDIHKGTSEGMSKEVADIDAEMVSSGEQIKTFQNAYTQLGASSEKLDARLKSIGATMVTNKTAATGYTVAVGGVGNAQSKTATKTVGLEEQVAKLTAEFNAGRISAQEYIITLNRLNGTGLSRAGTTSAANPMANLFTMGGLKGIGGKALNLAKGVGGMMLLTGAMNVAGNIGSGMVLTPAQQMSQRYESLKSINQMADNASSEGFVGAVGGYIGLGIKSIISGISNFFGDKSSPGFGDIYNPKYMTEAGLEQLRQESDIATAEEQKKEQEKYDSSRLHLAGGKHADTTKMSWTEVTSAEEGQQMISRINTQLGYTVGNINTEVALKNSSLILQGYRDDSEEMRKVTEDMLNAVIEAYKNAAAEVKGRMAEIEKAFPGAYEDNEAWQEANKDYMEKQQALADAETKRHQVEVQGRVTKIENDAQRALQDADIATISGQAKAASLGYGEGSDAYQKATREGINAAIKAKQVEASGLKTQASAANGQEKEDIVRKANQVQADIAQLYAQLYQSTVSRVDYLQERAGVAQGMRDASTRASLSEALLRGYGENSSYYKSIERTSLLGRNKDIDQLVSQLKVEADRAKNDDRDKILLRIAELQAESRDNLVKIQKSLSTGATFNIPSGIKPITFAEAMMQGNTENSMAVTQGNVSITVRIDNVYGQSKEDVEKNIAKPVIDQIKDQMETQRRATNALVDQYRRKVGNFRV